MECRCEDLGTDLALLLIAIIAIVGIVLLLAKESFNDLQHQLSRIETRQIHLEQQRLEKEVLQ